MNLLQMQIILFTFLIVNLKPTNAVNDIDADEKFTFLIVNLKLNFSISNKTDSLEFTFLIVNLKQ